MSQPPPDPNQPYQAYGSYGPGPGPQGTDAKGFLAALFDFSFTSFITPKIVKFAYILFTVLIGLGMLVFIGAGLSSGSAGFAVLTLLMAPLVALVYLVLIRMTLEFYVAVVRMSEDIHQRLPQR